MKDFMDWLKEEIKARNWSQSEAARRMGISQGMLSLILRGERSAGIQFCKAVARGFNLDEAVIARKAGLFEHLIREDDLGALIKDIVRSAQRLSRIEQEWLLKYIYLRLDVTEE